MNFISREDVLQILKNYDLHHHRAGVEIEALWFFPAPNPEEKDNKNVMEQTEEEFWRLVDKQI